MPQTFQVLRCYKCSVFQVHITKKSIKWECKLCGVKQSIKRHYGIGTAKDCRIHVQKLNNIRGEIDELKCGQMRKNAVSDDETEFQELDSRPVAFESEVVKNSKWTNYIEGSEVSEVASEDSMLLGEVEVVLEIPKKRRKQFQNTSKVKYDKVVPTIDTNIMSFMQSKNNKTLHYEAPQSEFETSEVQIHQSDALDHIKIEKENSKVQVSPKIFIPPKINKNSKWAQFAEIEESNIPPTQDISASQNNSMFSLCDDSDLDNILDL